MIKRQSQQFSDDIRALIISSGMTRVYVGSAPESKTFPYAVMDVRGAGTSMTIELDVWGSKGNEPTLENDVDNIEVALDHALIANQYHTSAIFTNNDRKWVANDDENIIHINLSFNATYQS